MPFSRYACGVQYDTLSDWGPDPQRRGDLGVEPKTCKCLLMIHQGAAAISDSAFYRIISVLVIIIIITVVVVVVVIIEHFDL